MEGATNGKLERIRMSGFYFTWNFINIYRSESSSCSGSAVFLLHFVFSEVKESPIKSREIFVTG